MIEDVDQVLIYFDYYRKKSPQKADKINLASALQRAKKLDLKQSLLLAESLVNKGFLDLSIPLYTVEKV
jgi:hypothetical protein